MSNSMVPPPAPLLGTGSFQTFQPSLFGRPRTNISVPAASMPSAGLNMLGAVNSNANSQRPLTVVAFRPLGNSGRGSPPGTRHRLHKIKIPRSVISKLQEDDTVRPEFDYGVAFPRPKSLPQPLTLNNRPVMPVGYNPDGSLRFAPVVSPSNGMLNMSANNSFTPFAQLHEGRITEFTIFKKFPTELRIKIWKLALPSDRIIKISRAHPTAGFNRRTYEDGSVRGPFEIQCSSPGMLSACAEAREVALKTYTLSFNARLDGRPIYFDATRDILFFENTDVLNIFTGYPFDPERNLKKLYGDLVSIQKMIVCKDVTRNTVRLLSLYDNIKSVTFQEQVSKNLNGYGRMYDREAMAMADLWKSKREGGAGKGGCRVTFESEFLLNLVSVNPIWRRGMLDMQI